MNTAQRSYAEPPQSPWAFGMPDRLEKALKVAKVATSEMADALGVSRNTISNYTSGRTSPSRLQVKEWSVRTGAPLEWLLDGIDPNNPPRDYLVAGPRPVAYLSHYRAS